MMFNLSRRQWAWWLALIFWIVAFIFTPILPEGKITEIVRNMQLIAAVIVAVFYGLPNKPKEKPSDDKEDEK